MKLLRVHGQLTDAQRIAMEHIKLRHKIGQPFVSVVLGAASRFYWEETGKVIKTTGEAAECLWLRDDLIARGIRIARALQSGGTYS